MLDIPMVVALINAYARDGIMLPRTEFEMAENIRDFLVAFDETRLVGDRGAALLHSVFGRNPEPGGATGVEDQGHWPEVSGGAGSRGPRA